MELRRGEIYDINFPYTHDKNYPMGKRKFVVVLQEGEEFANRDSIVALVTNAKDHLMTVTVDKGTTKLHKEAYILCSQPYTLPKSVFYGNKVWCAGKLDSRKLDEIDTSLYIGLCMGLQDDQ